MANPEKKPSARRRGDFVDDLFAAVGRPLSLETVEGVRRNGRLTGLRTHRVKFNGFEQDHIQELELNGDPGDTVPVERIQSLTID